MYDKFDEYGISIYTENKTVLNCAKKSSRLRRFEDVSRRCEPSNVSYFIGPPCGTGFKGKNRVHVVRFLRGLLVANRWGRRSVGGTDRQTDSGRMQSMNCAVQPYTTILRPFIVLSVPAPDSLSACFEYRSFAL